MSVRTKIICTIGPAVDSYEQVCALIDAGMTVARINFSHGDYSQHERIIGHIKKARETLDKPIGIMLDTKGPEVRLGTMRDGRVSLQAGGRWLLTKEAIVGDEERVSILPGTVLNEVQIDSRILFDDGYISSRVVEIKSEGVVVEIENSGEILSGKGVNLPYLKLGLPSLTDRDREDLKFGCLHDIEYVAASFIRTADDVLAIKKVLAEQGKPETMVIAKIENFEGVENFDSIVQVADGIMVARGDLGVEVPLAQVPKLQKMMIRKCYLAGKPAVTATQMLESMINFPRPTRAETSDVANAIYDSTSAVMLSGETAIGKYPIKVTAMMREIAKEAETDFNYRNFFNHYAPLAYHDVPSSVTLATVKTAYSSNASAIFVFTSTGSTARLLSRLRPQIPIIALTPNKKTYHQMALFWGVVPVFGSASTNIVDAFAEISAFALDHGLVNFGDLVIVTAGSPFGVAGTTNTMIVESIGDVLVRGDSGLGKRVHGKITQVLTPEGRTSYSVSDRLIVIAKCDESYLSLMESAKGIILQNHVDDIDSETFVMQKARELGKPAIVRADAAFNNLKEGALVTLDPEKALVYKGVVL
ncbi:MAG: pyruvate kinase [Chlamydiia bacterium]|nr:pyruvate kinase [Chlamydiia bacterium]